MRGQGYIYRLLRVTASVLAILSSVSSPNMVHAQGCSRNMLRISGPESYVAAPDVRGLRLPSGFTIECWARLDSTTTPFAALADKGSYGIFLKTDSTLYGMVARHSSSIAITTPGIDSLRNWHHFALVYTPNDSLRLYVDSNEVTRTAISFSTIDSTLDSLRIGMSISGYSWIGSIDEFRVWNIPRSISQIRQTLFHTLPGDDSGLVLYYSFDDEAGSIRIHDFSGHGRDGLLVGTNAAIVPSNSPVIDASPGFRLAAVESRIIIPTQRCKGAFDTVVHVRNLGSTPLLVDTAGFSVGQVFSIVPNSEFVLPADSTKLDSLRLHFEPNSGGFYFDSLYVSSSSDCGGRIIISVEARYDSVGLIANMDTLRFGPITQCSSDTVRSVTVRNTSVTDSVTIQSVHIPPGSGLRVLNPFPITLGKDSSITLFVALDSGIRGPLAVAIGFELDKCSREALLDVSALRQHDALSMPSVMNLGSAQATLAGVTRDVVIVVTNTGDVPSKISRILPGPAGLLQAVGDTTGVYKLPGDTTQVHIRLTATDCGTNTGKVQIIGGQCSEDTVTSVITINLIPPANVFAPSADYGVTCAPKATTIFVTNPDSIPVRLDSISYSTNFIFSNGPLFMDTIPAHDSIPVTFQFSPLQNGDYNDTVYFHTTPCGLSFAVLSGKWGFDGLAFDSSQLLLGRGCKVDSVHSMATLTNNSTRSITISNYSYTGSKRIALGAFTAPVVLMPGQSHQFLFNYAPSLGHLDTARLNLLSPEGCVEASLFLRGSREIAKAVWANMTGEFDTVCPGDSSFQSFQLFDKGIDSIDVVTASVTGQGFSLVSSPQHFAGNGSFEVRFTPKAEQSYAGSLTVTVDRCGNAFTLPLHGSGGPSPHIVVLDTEYNFGNLLVGDSGSYCLAITNPSCSAINVLVNSSAFIGTPFHLLGGPDTVPLVRGDTANLCIQFSPTTYGAYGTSLLLASDSIPSQNISLRGIGLSPDVRFSPHMLDFGYVLLNSSQTQIIRDTNAGNLATTIGKSNDNPPFNVQSPASLAPGSSNSIAVTFSPTLTGLFEDTVHFLWSGHTDSVILRGFGADSGLQLSAVALDFGNVHVGTDSTLPLYLFARDNFPRIDRVSIANELDTFSYSSLTIFPRQIQSDSDSILIQVTYHAHLEKPDLDSLLIYSNGSVTSVPLTGNGVEAHAKVSTLLITFDTVQLGDSSAVTKPETLSNTGGYELFVKPLPVDTVFQTTTDSAATPILAHSSREYSISFHPVRARTVVDTLQFFTTSPDALPPVILIGTGIYPAGTGPDFSYSVDSLTAEPGEFDSIPIYLNGIRLSKIDADTLMLTIQFDPQMVRILGADEGPGKPSVSFFRQTSDSTIQAGILTNMFDSGMVMRLHTEALLGPHDTSFIHVIETLSAPAATQPAMGGQFIVADCGGPAHGVVFAGPYTTSAVVPNPVGDQARLQFILGLDGPVTVDLYNSIGQPVKHIDAGTAKAGPHTLLLDLSGLPEGQYVYRLASLEYRAQGSIVVLR